MTPMSLLITMIREPNRSKCFAIWNDNVERFKLAQGSSHNHQAWAGGYVDHITEVMNVAITLHGALSKMRPLPFELADALLVLFLHDLEKPWKAELGFRTKFEKRMFRNAKFAEYGFELTDTQSNALFYIEGEGNDYSPSLRVMNELAAFCHLCDVTSARIWHDQPRGGLAAGNPKP